MKLKELISSLKIINISRDINSDIEIEDIVYNSGFARKNTLFVALIGMSLDGHKYIQDAYDKGVRVFLVSRDNFKYEDAIIVQVEDTRDALANISNKFFGEPSKEIKVIGITGTKGKTTVSNYIKQILDNSGLSCGVIGTNGVYYADEYIKTVNTTPESYEIQKYMRQMIEKNVKVLAMEVSSGGIMMNRVNYIYFDYGLFTNISPDHIGEKEHPTFEHYVECKAKFFSMCRHSIINEDDELSHIIKEKANDYESYSIDKNSNFIAKNIKYPKSISDIKTYFSIEDKEYLVNSFGKFGVYNALCTIVLCQKLGLSYEQIRDGLSKAHVKGRLQTLDIIKDIPVIIDYAHNEVSLENILRTVKNLNPKRIITLFGSIGGRAKHRRVELAQVSAKYSDIIVVTSDNPDYEDMQSIIDEVLSYIPKEKLENTYNYIDRALAIKKAIEISKPGDVIVLAGKGHEEYQLINGKREYFSDEEQAKKWAKELKNQNMNF